MDRGTLNGRYKRIKKNKKIYGERFARLCRDMFPVILEQEGTLLNILENTFSHNCNSLYESITGNGLETEFKKLIYNKFDIKREIEEKDESRTPYEILDEAGYNLYECKTEEDIQKFRKYYAPNEVLCTIYNGGRLNTRDCFFAVKKDVDKIKREDFWEPDKNDKYSTSVLGIQFTREKESTVQIISRYNHTVINPNCTLGNDLDRLVPGLKQSFANLLEERGLDISNYQSEEHIEIPGYTMANNGKYYKYNMEIDGEYYCPGNIVISNGVAKRVIEPEKGILMDYFCLDLENKDNQIVKYENQYVQQIGNDFLNCNEALTKLNLPNLQQAGDDFLYSNATLKELSLPKLQYAGSNFLYYNKTLTNLNLPKLQYTRGDFLIYNTSLTSVNLPLIPRLQEMLERIVTKNISNRNTVTPADIAN